MTKLTRLEAIEERLRKLRSIESSAQRIMVDTGDVDREVYRRAVEEWRKNPLIYLSQDTAVNPLPSVEDMDLLVRLARLVCEKPVETEYGDECPACGGDWYGTKGSPATGDPKYADLSVFTKAWGEWAKEHPDEAYYHPPTSVSGPWSMHFGLPLHARIPDHLRYTPAVEPAPGHEIWCPIAELLSEVGE